jgi:site-specific DNA recombinase
MKKWTNKTAIIYTRVSTTDQKDYGHSLVVQKDLLIDFCEKNNINILEHFEDDHSAKNFNRPAFKRLLAYSKKNKVDLLLCYDWSRFSRDMYLSFEVISKFRKRNIEVNTISQVIDYDDSSHLTMLAIHTSQPHVSNLERSKNTKKGNNGALRSGRFINRAPVGYYNDKGMNKTKQPTIQIDFKKSRLIKEIFTKYATGLYSQESIRKDYYNQGLKLSKSQFSNMLSNITYIGKVYVPIFENLPSKIVNAIHEQIIDEVTFHKVQRIKYGKANIRLNSKKTSKHEDTFPLRGGILKCVRCEANLTGSYSTSRNGSKKPYYHCNKGCKERFSVNEAHNELLNFLASLKAPNEVLKLFKLILIDDYKLNQKERIQKAKTFKLNKEKLEENLDKLTDKYVSDYIDKTRYDSLKSRYESQLQDLSIKLDDLSDYSKDLDKYVDFGIHLLMSIDVFYKRATTEIKRRIIGSIFSEKLIFEDKKYRTAKLNEGIAVIFSNSRRLQNQDNKKRHAISNVSYSVAGTGLEPVTFGL